MLDAIRRWLTNLHDRAVRWWYDTVGTGRIASWASHYLVVRIPTHIAVAVFGFSGAYVGLALVAVYLIREAVQSHEAGADVDTVDKVGDWGSAFVGFADAVQWIP